MKASVRSGQILLITLLVLTIATTVGLSLIARTKTDLNINNQIQESSQAFSAAEAGIEQALRNSQGTGVTPIPTSGVSYQVDKIDIVSDASFIYSFPKTTSQGSTDVLWLTTHDETTGALNEVPASDYLVAASPETIDVCWSSASPMPALVVTYFYKRGATYEVARQAFDPNNGRAATNKFTVAPTVSGCGASSGTAYKVTLNLQTLPSPALNVAADTALMIRFRALYSDTHIVVQGVRALPKQGNIYESTGTTNTGLNRTIQVYQTYKAPSSIFDYVLYSQQGPIQVN